MNTWIQLPALQKAFFFFLLAELKEVPMPSFGYRTAVILLLQRELIKIYNSITFWGYRGKAR